MPKHFLCAFLLFVLYPFSVSSLLKSRILSEQNSDPNQNNPNQNEKTAEIREETEEDEMAVTKYFETPADELKCGDHVKMMELAYRCMDSKSQSENDLGIFQTEDIEGQGLEIIYVVSKNGNKFFMKVLDSLYDLELKLERKFVENEMVPWLAEYKIVNNRFVGIYVYRNQRNTVRHNIVNGNFSLYEKVYLLEKIVGMASKFYNYTNPHNNLIQLDLTPGNTLLLESGYLNILFTNLLVVGKKRVFRMSAPEYSEEEVPINQKASCVYSIGHVIFFYLFGRRMDGEDLNSQQEVQSLMESQDASTERAVKLYLIESSRGMLHENPIDRPSIEMVLDQIKKARLLLETPFHQLERKMLEYKWVINTELIKEQKDIENLKKAKARIIVMKNKNLSKTKKKIGKEFNMTVKLHILKKKGQKFFDYEGKRKDCDIEPTKTLINNSDLFGMFPSVKNSLISDKSFQKAFEKLGKYPEEQEMELKEKLEKNLQDPENMSKDITQSKIIKKLRFEFFVLLGISTFIICLIVSYFFLKGLEVKMYRKNEFQVNLIVF